MPITEDLTHLTKMEKTHEELILDEIMKNDIIKYVS